MVNLLDVSVSYLNAPCNRINSAKDAQAHCCFACTTLTQDYNILALLQLQIDISQNGLALVHNRDVV